jgi:hypothetical protein
MLSLPLNRVRLLANLMLPDGAEKQLEDWTIFFLNQTPFNTISPVLALETPEPNWRESHGGSELLYVLNLVRTKHDKSVRRYVVVSYYCFSTLMPSNCQRCSCQSYGDLHATPLYSDIQSTYAILVVYHLTDVRLLFFAACFVDGTG